MERHAAVLSSQDLRSLTGLMILAARRSGRPTESDFRSLLCLTCRTLSRRQSLMRLSDEIDLRGQSALFRHRR